MANLAPMSEVPEDASTSTIAPILQVITTITKFAALTLVTFSLWWTICFASLREWPAQRARRLRELPRLPPINSDLLRMHTELTTAAATIKRVGEDYISLRSKLQQEDQARLGPELD
ncbi:hypothetical protein LTR56_013556 [Elasticomyces elasticus]|nr:hypothetical protein LTR56_013556 [Elasticomyces elasticus]KAK3651020.1 hypothetical protein LTR22_012268 [Elasticomyces elasticus]KAK4931098.1 hypothetical protein LTR49_002514 [Elasticomyces elasticus]KAK5765566.1 hypothetical protein LTS12_004318 [Elasticomyces elasticus]